MRIPRLFFYTGVIGSQNTAVKKIRSWDDAWPSKDCFKGKFRFPGTRLDGVISNQLLWVGTACGLITVVAL